VANNDNNWSITLKNFSNGFSPLAFTDSLTELGNGGSASAMTNVDVLDSRLQQGSGLSNLAGTLNEEISFIMDKAVATNVSYAIGTSKLFTLTATTVASLHDISSCTEGESLSLLKGNLYYFYNTSSEGRIGKYDLVSTFTDSWATGLQLAPHPSDKKEDIMVFGNGRYAGVYIQETGDLTVDKLDFGNDMEVADVLYNAGLWYIAVNSNVSGANRTEGQIYLYDGAALVNTLTDETGVGVMKIGFLYRINGIIYVAYTDITSDSFIIGYVNGKSITPLVRYTGSLPNFQQKTLFRNTILFISDGLIYSAGAIVPQLPFALSQIADGGYTNVGAIAAPFGDVLVSSDDGGSNYRIAKFENYDTNSSWKSIVFSVVSGFNMGYIDEIVCLTNALESGARADLTIEANQAVDTSSVQQITTTGKTRHRFNSFGLGKLEDFRIAISFANGSTTKPVKIRKIIVKGHWVEG